MGVMSCSMHGQWCYSEGQHMGEATKIVLSSTKFSATHCFISLRIFGQHAYNSYLM